MAKQQGEDGSNFHDAAFKLWETQTGVEEYDEIGLGYGFLNKYWGARHLKFNRYYLMNFNETDADYAAENLFRHTHDDHAKTEALAVALSLIFCIVCAVVIFSSIWVGKRFSDLPMPLDKFDDSPVKFAEEIRLHMLVEMRKHRKEIRQAREEIKRSMVQDGGDSDADKPSLDALKSLLISPVKTAGLLVLPESRRTSTPRLYHRRISDQSSRMFLMSREDFTVSEENITAALPEVSPTRSLPISKST